MKLKLKKLKNFSGRKGPLLFVIMDGVGIGKNDSSNAVYLADTPCLDKLFKEKLYTPLNAHGMAVGMPSDDDMGNSEVGHNAMGAGRVFDQGSKIVNKAIKEGTIYEGPIWKEIVSKCQSVKGAKVHFIGLLSDGNVHSHIDQLFSLLNRMVHDGVKKVRLHILLDGRDVPERSAIIYINKLENLLFAINKDKSYDYRIASGGGRMVTTMDRYNADWSVVKRGWDAHVLGKGRFFSSAREAVEAYYKEDPSMTDQYMGSFVITENSKPVGKIEDSDSVIFFNFRGDRAVEIARAFTEKDFKEFERDFTPDILFAGMMEYDGDLHIPEKYLVNPPVINKTVSEYLCSEGVAMFAISETQKFGHVTYFWNGNKSGYVCRGLEEYIEIPSDKVRFDKAPQMKAYEIAEKTTELLKSGKFKFGRLNFANGDMVGHTAVKEAIIKSVEVVDICVQKLIDEVKRLNGICVITADHGNSDEMFVIKDGKEIPKTSHTVNPVPFIIIDSGYNGEYKIRELNKRGLSNIAATLLNLLGYEKPEEYDQSLIEFI